jgi:hypothetical protein
MEGRILRLTFAVVIRGFNLEVQPNIVLFAPLGRDVYRTRDRQKILLAPAERNTSRSPGQCGKHCAPLERELSDLSSRYKHLAPLERKRIALLHLEVEFTIT